MNLSTQNLQKKITGFAGFHYNGLEFTGCFRWVQASVGVAVLLQKLSVTFVGKCTFSKAHTAVILNELTVSSHLIRSPAVPLLISLLPGPPIPRSFSLISLFCL